MSRPTERAVTAWVSWWTNVVARDPGLMDLIVNLACAAQARSAGFTSIVVLVDSRSEALLLRVLRLVAVIPRCNIRVVHQPDDLRGLAEPAAGGKTLLLASARLFLKQHQAVAALRRQFSVVVV